MFANSMEIWSGKGMSAEEATEYLVAETEFFYDVRPPEERYGPEGFVLEEAAGRLIVGRAAANELLNDYGPEAIRSLPELLTEKEFLYTSSDFIHESQSWSKKETELFGVFLLRVVERADEPAAINGVLKQHVERMRILGIGPSPWQINKNFHDMAGFREAINMPHGKMVHKFDNWAEEDFIEYARKVDAYTPGAPREDDYQAFAREQQGPGLGLLVTRIGGVRALNEHLGYPNVRSWDRDDYVDWGVKVIRANPAIEIDRSVLNYFSKIERGPSSSAVRRNFTDNIGNFHRAVREEYERRELIETRTTELLEKEYARLRAMTHPRLTAEVVQNIEETGRRHFTAKYLLSRKCLPSRDEDTWVLYGLKSAQVISSSISKLKTGVDEGTVSSMASALNLYDEIWPPKDIGLPEYLIIDENRLRRERALAQ